MIKASGADWRHIAQSALHLVGDGQGREKLTALPSCILSRRQHRRQIVARMTGLVLGEVTVIKIEIMDECSIEQGRPIGRGSSASDQSTVAVPPKSSICSRISRTGSAWSVPIAQPSESRILILSCNRADSERLSKEAPTTNAASCSACVTYVVSCVVAEIHAQVNAGQCYF